MATNLGTLVLVVVISFSGSQPIQKSSLDALAAKVPTATDGLTEASSSELEVFPMIG